MEILKKRAFDRVKPAPEPKKDDLLIPELTETEFNKMLEDMQHPVKAQQRIAVQIKRFLDKRIAKEMRDKGVLSDHTRRWVETYNSLLDKIQKSLYGDKSVNLHLHKVSHSQIASKIREATEVSHR